MLDDALPLLKYHSRQSKKEVEIAMAYLLVPLTPSRSS